MAEDKFLKLFKEHSEQDRKDNKAITKELSKIKSELENCRKDIQVLQKQVQPMVNQDEHIKWLAQKVTTVMKVVLVIITIIATAFGIYKGLGK